MPIIKTSGGRDGKQRYRVIVNYTDNQGKYRKKERHVYGLQEAKDMEMRLAYELKESPVSSKITVGHLYTEYKESKKHELRESTLDRNDRIIKRHILPTEKEKRLDKIDLQSLQKWKSSIAAKGLSHNTNQGIYSCYRALLNYATIMGYLSSNPLSKLGNFVSAGNIEKNDELVYYTKDEYEKFIMTALDVAKSNKDLADWHYYVFFSIAFYTGMRKGEIYGLRWTDINVPYLTIRRSVNQKLLGEDRITLPKNKSSIRTIQIPQTLIKILLEHKNRCSQIEGFSEDCYICGGKVSIRDTTLKKRNERYAKLANVKTIKIHDFRHSHASLLANSGINIQEIARRLGHSRVEMTWNIYSHLYPQEQEKAIEILDSLY